MGHRGSNIEDQRPLIPATGSPRRLLPFLFLLSLLPLFAPPGLLCPPLLPLKQAGSLLRHLILGLVFVLEDDIRVRLTTSPCYGSRLTSPLTQPAAHLTVLKVLRVWSWCLLYAQPYRPGSCALKAFDQKGRPSSDR